MGPKEAKWATTACKWAVKETFVWTVDEVWKCRKAFIIVIKMGIF